MVDSCDASEGDTSDDSTDCGGRGWSAAILNMCDVCPTTVSNFNLSAILITYGDTILRKSAIPAT